MIHDETSLPFNTLPELLAFRATHQPSDTAFVFLPAENIEQITISYEALYVQSQIIAAHLQQFIEPGERVLLIYSSGLEFIAAFFACLSLGIIAVPVALPRTIKGFNQLKPIVKNAAPRAVLTLASLEENIRSNLPQLMLIVTDTLSNKPISKISSTLITKESLAFLQYTSGSTGQPKGVMVSHANLLHNQLLIKKAFNHNDQSIIVGWLPFYHDMGLIGNLLQPIFLGRPCIFMPPMVFLQNPFFWLATISRFRATTSGGPNFSYDLCLRKISDEQRKLLDLSSWTVAYNGAEPVQANVINEFAHKFSICGFNKQAFLPCYGMAESTLIVTGGGLNTRPQIISVDKEHLLVNKIKVNSSAEHSLQIVGCGEKTLIQDLIIASPEDFRSLGENEVGEIWLRGSSVTQGYWENPSATNDTFNAYISNSNAGPYLRTGDLGFLNNEQLYIVGRLKDLIIIRGRNYYPQDIEQCVVTSHVAFKINASAAFSILIENEEKLILVQEIERSWRKNLNVNDASTIIRKVIVDNFDLHIHEIVFVNPEQIPKTSSGKIMRRACKTLYETNGLQLVYSRMESSLLLPQKNTEISLSDVILLSMEARFNYCLDFFIHHISFLLKIPVDTIDVNRSLNFLGIDSLLAAEIQNIVENKLKLNWPVVRFLQDETIFQLAKAAALDLVPGKLINESPMTVGNEPEQHLSSSQLPIWFWHQLYPEASVYHIDFALKINAPLDTSIWRNVWNILIKRHPVLRTSYYDSKNAPYKVTQEEPILSLEVIDFPSKNDLQEVLKKEVLRPFFLDQAPPFRLKLYILEPNSFVFLFVAHHIACDLHSIRILMQEFLQLYAQSISGQKLNLPSLFLEAQKNIHFPMAEKEDELYWINKLSNCPEALNLNMDHSRPPVQTFSAATVNFGLDKQLFSALSNLVKEQGTTLYVLLLTTFQLLLHRYTHQNEILIGTAVAVRDQAHTRNVLGCFINSLVIRGTIDADLSFLQYLQQVRQTVLEALQHQHYPFHKLVNLLQKKRDLSRSPIFQAMFILHNIQDVESEVTALFENQNHNPKDTTIELFFHKKQSILVDLNLLMLQTSNGMKGCFEYNTDIFDEHTVQKMAEHFQQLLWQIVDSGQQKLKDLTFISSSERQYLLHALNQNLAIYPQESIIFTCLEKHSKERPHSIATQCGDKSLTYQDLMNQVNQMAHYLQQQGIKSTSLIGIALDRSVTMLVALLAVLKLGAAYLPLDPSYPRERLEYIINDANLSLILTETGLKPLLPAGGYRLIDLFEDEVYIAGLSTENLADIFSPSNMAYVIYTSGSTGRPKGVSIAQAALNNFLQAMHSLAILQPTDVLLAVTTICFDIAVLELFLPLIVGATVVIANSESTFNAENLASMIQRYKVNIMQATPATWQLLLAVSSSVTKGFKALVGGEALLSSVAKKLLDRGYDVYNLYGPTENTVWSSVYHLKQLSMDKWSNQRSIPIGKPLANVHYYVVDQYMQLVPQGVSGQLYIGGNNLALGYLNRPELTTAKFIEHCFGSDLTVRLYATGDLVRYLADGNLEFLGRIDNQIKLRGYRIELEEIENALLLHNSVDECAVLVNKNEADDSRLLVAFVASRSSLTDDELQHFLRASLPAYMIPSFFEFMPELPRTLNNKVDRVSLLSKSIYTRNHASFLSPTTASEEIVAAIWSELLSISNISVEDNFFHLGGHSLLALQVSNRLKDTYGIHLSLQIFFENQTLHALAAKIDEVKNKSVVDQAKVNSILEKIKNLSQEEVNKMLVEKIQ